MVAFEQYCGTMILKMQGVQMAVTKKAAQFCTAF